MVIIPSTTTDDIRFGRRTPIGLGGNVLSFARSVVYRYAEERLGLLPREWITLERTGGSA